MSAEETTEVIAEESTAERDAQPEMFRRYQPVDFERAEQSDRTFTFPLHLECQRVRWILVSIVYTESEILQLDRPTNKRFCHLCHWYCSRRIFGRLHPWSVRILYSTRYIAIG